MVSIDDVLSGINRSLMPFAILRLLAQDNAHGYALTAALEKMGFGSVRGGSLYPLLRRLEDGGLISSEWQGPSAGPARKVFRLTPEGRRGIPVVEAELERMLGSLSERKDSCHGQL